VFAEYRVIVNFSDPPRRLAATAPIVTTKI